MLPILLALSQVGAQPDLMITNAYVWSEGKKVGNCIVVRAGELMYVGDYSSALEAMQPKAKIDAGGKVVVPGLIDSHAHMLNGGIGLSQIQLRDAKDKEEFVNRIAEWSKKLPEGKWLTGGRYSTESWAVVEQPTKEWVDKATGNRPMFLSRMDGHSGLANSAALKLAGISKSGPADPPGGVIDRDGNGEPTGILRETAMNLVRRLIPAPDEKDKYEALKKAMKEANRFGITAVSDICAIGDLGVYSRMATSGEATVRHFLYPLAEDWGLASTLAKGVKLKEGWFEVKGFKAYMDGSLGSRTAFMRDPFLGNPADNKDWRGLPMPIVENGTFDKNAKAAAMAGMQTIAHAIGDQANHVLLEKLVASYPSLKSARCRTEHGQHMLASDVPRFGQLGVVCSMQPYHKADDGRYAESYIGPERSRSSYAFKSLLAGGAVVAFGSDWPVVTNNPFLGIQAAVTGKTLDGKAWQTQENISVDEALRCYTDRGAYATFQETRIGSLKPHMRADFVILNLSPFDADVDWTKMGPSAVYVDGKLVYEGNGVSDGFSLGYCECCP